MSSTSTQLVPVRNTTMPYGMPLSRRIFRLVYSLLSMPPPYRDLTLRFYSHDPSIPLIPHFLIFLFLIYLIVVIILTLSFHTVNLGSSGLRISRIILGCMSYGSKRWQEWNLEGDEAMEHIKHAYVSLSIYIYLAFSLSDSFGLREGILQWIDKYINIRNAYWPVILIFLSVLWSGWHGWHISFLLWCSYDAGIQTFDTANVSLISKLLIPHPNHY